MKGKCVFRVLLIAEHGMTEHKPFVHRRKKNNELMMHEVIHLIKTK